MPKGSGSLAASVGLFCSAFLPLFGTFIAIFCMLLFRFWFLHLHLAVSTPPTPRRSPHLLGKAAALTLATSRDSGLAEQLALYPWPMEGNALIIPQLNDVPNRYDLRATSGCIYRCSENRGRSFMAKGEIRGFGCEKI